MTKFILFVNELVIINKIVIPRIVRRIDVNDINLSLVRIGQRSKRFEVITLDNNMVGGG